MNCRYPWHLIVAITPTWSFKITSISNSVTVVSLCISVIVLHGYDTDFELKMQFNQIFGGGGGSVFFLKMFGWNC